MVVLSSHKQSLPADAVSESSPFREIAKRRLARILLGIKIVGENSRVVQPSDQSSKYYRNAIPGSSKIGQARTCHAALWGFKRTERTLNRQRNSRYRYFKRWDGRIRDVSEISSKDAQQNWTRNERCLCSLFVSGGSRPNAKLMSLRHTDLKSLQIKVFAYQNLSTRRFWLLDYSSTLIF